MTYLYSPPKMKICSLLPGLRNPRRKKIIRKRVSSGPPKMRVPSHCLLANSRRQKCKVGAGSPYSQNRAIAATSEKSKSAKKIIPKRLIHIARLKCVSHPIACLPIHVTKNAKSRRRVSLISKLSHRRQVWEIQVGKKIIPKRFTSPAENACLIPLLACRFASPKMQKVGAGSPYSQNRESFSSKRHGKIDNSKQGWHTCTARQKWKSVRCCQVWEIQGAKKSFEREFHPARQKCASHHIACLPIRVAKNAKSAPGLPTLKIVPSPPRPRNPSRQKKSFQRDWFTSPA